LSLYLSSDYFRYHQFFNAAQWGIDENRADLETLKQAPMAIVRLSPAELKEWAEMQRELAGISQRQFVDSEPRTDEQPRLLAILADLNNRVFELLRLSPTERWLVEDFVHLQMELIKGKVTKAVRKPPTSNEREAYLVSLRHCLDGFLSENRGLRHRLEVLADRDSALISVSLVRSKIMIEPVTHNADDAASRNLKVIRDRLRSKHSQWVYFDRALKVYERGVLYQFKPLQRLHWTRRQAVLDAADIIAETLAGGGDK
jgi:DNA-directed RNA polymerase subunit H (RpoH/RPB5)